MRYILSLRNVNISLKERGHSHGGNVVPARSREGVPTVGMDAELEADKAAYCLTNLPSAAGWRQKISRGKVEAK